MSVNPSVRDPNPIKLYKFCMAQAWGSIDITDIVDLHMHHNFPVDGNKVN